MTGASYSFISARRLKPEAALSAIVQFLARHDPFGAYELKAIVQSLQIQFLHNSNLIALESDKVVGYLGWLWTERSIAENWKLHGGRIYAKEQSFDAVAITILAVDDPKIILPMIKHAKTISQGLPVFWKRHAVEEHKPMRSVP
jgi:hypothetical protein